MCLIETVGSIWHESFRIRSGNLEASDCQRFLDFHRDLGFIDAPDVIGIQTPSLASQTTSRRRLALAEESVTGETE